MAANPASLASTGDELESLIGAALERGLGTLDVRELMALLAGPRVERALSAVAFVDLARAEPLELVTERALRGADALRVAAAFELGRRAEVALQPARARIQTPEDVRRALAADLRGRTQELFFVLALDGKHALVRRHCISLGSVNASLVHPREVFRPAIVAAAAAVICAHNHPSGDPEPSAEDLGVTRRLADAGKLLGIPLLDHVVLGEGRHVSLRQRMSWS